MEGSHRLKKKKYILSDEQKTSKRARYLSQTRSGKCWDCGEPHNGPPLRCSDCLKKNRVAQNRWYHEHKEIRKTQRRTYLQKVKREGLVAYSQDPPKCTCCGESTLAFLTLDHVNNDGAEDRKKLLGHSRAGNLISILRRNRYPNKDRYQVLCFNCNMGKSVNGGVCPHQQ